MSESASIHDMNANVAIQNIGLLERENASILNAAILQYGQSCMISFEPVHADNTQPSALSKAFAQL